MSDRRKRPSGDRRSIRLRSYDYSEAGTYFVTTCTKGRRPLFADAEAAMIAEQVWHWLPERFAHVELDELVVMPDHVHFLISILEGSSVSLGHLVGTFKTVCAKKLNVRRVTPGASVWQRNYYEHIVGGDAELERIRDYIISNPFMEHSHANDDTSAAWRAR